MVLMLIGVNIELRLQDGVYIDDVTTAYRINQSIPYDYVVWKDTNVAPTLYRAESNVAGVDDESNAAFTTLLNTVAQDDTVVYIKPGTYVAATADEINPDGDNIRIIGAGRGATIIDFSSAGGGSLFTLGDGVNRRSVIEISGMSLKGANAGGTPQTAINVDYARRLLFQDLEIYYFAGASMWAIEGRMADAEITNCHLWTNTAGIKIDGASNNTANKITNNYIFNSAAATGWLIYIDAGSTLNRICDNIFEGTVNRVYLNASNNVFANNTFEWVNNVAVIDLDVDDNHNVIKGNYFTNIVNLITGNEVDGTLRSPTPIDIDAGAAVTQYWHFPAMSYITNAYIVYTEGSGADNCAIKLGKETDDDYFYTGNTANGQPQWTTETLTLLKHTILDGDTLIFNSANALAVVGEIVLVIEYVAGGWSSI